jgi:transposase
MSHHLSMSIVHSIETLTGQGWSQRRIARELGIDRGAVARHQRLAAQREAKPATMTAGSEAPPPSKPAKVTAGFQDRCRGFEQAIEAKIEAGLSAQRIWQDLVAEQGFSASYQSVKRFVRRAKARQPKRTWRIECAPAEELQVDFGAGPMLCKSDGRRVRTWVFRCVLGCSRKGNSEAVLKQDTETFIRCLENAFRRFGGVTVMINVDNLKAAVTRADWYDPELNPKLVAFCAHYGTILRPSRPYHPQDKGKVEAAVKYVRHNALKGRDFESIAEINRWLDHWESKVADLRIHGTTREQVQARFVRLEQPALRPLPIDLFPCYQEGRRRVHRDCFIEVAKAYYAVPVQYLQRDVWVRWDGREVRVSSLTGEAIVTHARLEPGRFTETLGCAGQWGPVERALAYWHHRAATLGPGCAAWAREVESRREAQALRVIQGLCSLTKKHRSQDLDRACAAALDRGQWHLADIRTQLASPSKQTLIPFVAEHPLIRPLGEYGALVGDPFSSSSPTSTP